MADNSSEHSLLELTAQIVAAYIGNNSVPSGEIANLIGQVHTALKRVVGAPAAAPAALSRPPERRDPAADQQLAAPRPPAAPSSFDDSERTVPAPPRPAVSFAEPEVPRFTAPQREPEPAAVAAPQAPAPPAASAGAVASAAEPAEPAGPVAEPAPPLTDERAAQSRPGKKNARSRRSSVPSWDEIMLGSSRQRD